MLSEGTVLAASAVRPGEPWGVLARAMVAPPAGGKQQLRIPVRLVPLRNAERRRCAAAQEGDVVKPLKGPGDSVTYTDLDGLGKEGVGVDTGVGGGTPDDHRPRGGRCCKRARR